MGHSNYSHDDYSARQAYRKSTGTSAFVHQAAIDAGRVRAGVDPKMNPKGVTREARDSDQHPVTVPIGVIMDTTGSMQEVPRILQASLNKLMGTFLGDKASGKHYLGDGYPAILIGANDDFFAMGYHSGGEGALQVGQFESGLEIDDDLGRIWFTGMGGGNDGESYDLALYFFARRTATDHWDKRHRKGYLFLIGDEKWFPSVQASAVEAIIGDHPTTNLSTRELVHELRERWHVYFIMPNLTSHWENVEVHRVWQDLLGPEHFIRLEKPNEICALLASLVAVNEGHATTQDLATDGIAPSVTSALALIAQTAAVDRAADKLPPVPGSRPGVKRL